MVQFEGGGGGGGGGRGGDGCGGGGGEVFALVRVLILVLFLSRMYRGRCGAFAPESLGAGHTAEEALHQHLSDWMDDLVAGADLSRTSISRQYPDNVFRHFQYTGSLSESSGGETADDFHSPVQPDRYISLRLRPMMSFYQARIPRYTRSGTLMLTALGVFSVAASSLAYLGFADFVVIITAAGAAITSYLEFTGNPSQKTSFKKSAVYIKLAI